MAQDMAGKAQGVARAALGTMMTSDEGRLGRITEKEVRLIAEGLQIPSLKLFFPLAQLSLQLGILSFLLLCSLLLGLNFEWNYPSVPDMWIYYSIPVTISTFCAMPFLFWMSHPVFVAPHPESSARARSNKARTSSASETQRETLLRLQDDLEHVLQRPGTTTAKLHRTATPLLSRVSRRLPAVSRVISGISGGNSGGLAERDCPNSARSRSVPRALSLPISRRAHRNGQTSPRRPHPEVTAVHRHIRF